MAKTTPRAAAGIRQCLDEHGNPVAEGAEGIMRDDQVVEALRWMLLSRAFDARATTLQRQGRFGTYSPVKGQEASVVGTAMALDPARDWVVPSYRELPALARQGYPLDRMFAGYMGKVRYARIPDGVRVLPNQVALATQLPHAVGLAWGLKLQHLDSVVMPYFGDGASSEGDFHEALNLAGVTQAPVVFVLQNNQWAISTSRAVQSAVEFFSVRAAGYGFPGVTVDGNDLLAVYSAAEEAVVRARAGGGPTLIETITYRLSFHNTTDNPREYLPEGWLEEAEKKDPILRLERWLTSRGLWDEGARAAMEGEIAEQMDAALAAAAAAPAVRPGDVFADVYADPPERLLRQRRELVGDE
jgi:pyruvate dehydrogenase E1 component alpha subunit